ncbi:MULTISPECIES: conserved virulence factor C family protein [unclassified Staphylococcus]|uniref:conserved virulence factor C family protein n=1 Tax=unclassified Staphylococcus TaxID=91994 RepID=UPI0021D078E3|nr:MULTISPECIES: conserved virulence factor C family protein [unclassified Staphylococcus]UXR79226.1 conserved virulence factor C family protein [Staphylococcus sp. IVB6227]UXR83443.1 conserved virulence factor C family protein [Staphylococcus sp. IVB6214]
MEIIKIEPTPSPNTMKIVISEKRHDNQSNTFTEVHESQPAFINQVLSIDGVKSIFYVLDFLAVDKMPKADWEEVLPRITATLNGNQGIQQEKNATQEHFGEVKAEVLKFKDIPYQIKLTTDTEEQRRQLNNSFIEAMTAAQLPGDNVVFLRKWHNLGIRYGELEQIMDEVEEEMNALYPNEVLQQLVSRAEQKMEAMPTKEYHHVTLETYKQADDWKARLRMLTAFPKPTDADYPLLAHALTEEKVQLRREAIVLLSMIETKETLPYLYKGLRDKSPAVRRAAGDALSDLGFAEALTEMEHALDDPHKIVRWRAAMFLFDEGGEAQLPALKAHQDDSAYEVRMQIEMAITRIEQGEAALGSVWKQIANRKR